MHNIVAIVGRPNVGKSTLFNRLSIDKKAITHNFAGVTRDRKYSDAKLGDIEFKIIDTPGLEHAKEGEIQSKMLKQTIQAVDEADLIFFVVDGKVGLTPDDEKFAKILRKTSKNQIVIVNKCEKHSELDQRFYKLDKDLIGISAEHGIGLTNLYEKIVYFFSKNEIKDQLKELELDINGSARIKIAIVGKPNAGKSTFINKILGQDRLLTSSEAGTTRDSIDISFELNKQKYSLIDTAGLRKKSNITQSLEKMAASDTINNINFAQIVILILDATHPLEQQDLAIANYTLSEGRVLVIIVNKWDLITDKKAFIELFEHKTKKNLSQLKDIKILFISSSKDKNFDHVFNHCLDLYQAWNTKFATNKLNNWLQAALENHNLPLQSNGRRIRLKYITQTKIRPPTFKIFTNNIQGIDDNYKRYLINYMREYFKLPAIPIRLVFDKSDNPYNKS